MQGRLFERLAEERVHEPEMEKMDVMAGPWPKPFCCLRRTESIVIDANHGERTRRDGRPARAPSRSAGVRRELME